MKTVLTPEQQQTMQWAGLAFRKMWFDLCDRLALIERGEVRPAADYLFDPFFLPFPLDARWLYPVLRHGGSRLMLGKNASLFTIVLNEAGDEIIWSALERAQDGVFVEYHVLNERLDQPWAQEAAQLMKQGRLDEVHRQLSAWVQTQDDLRHIEVGVVKIAHLQFFAALEQAWKQSDDGRRLAEFTVRALDAVRQIVENRWLRFSPPVVLGDLLDLLLPLLRSATPWLLLATPLLHRLPPLPKF